MESILLHKTKSINCYSCGAGINGKITDDNKCNCEYCGNTNIILEGGNTKIATKANKPFSSLSTAKKVILLTSLAVVGVGLFLAITKTKKKKEKNNRKLLLFFK